MRQESPAPSARVRGGRARGSPGTTASPAPGGRRQWSASAVGTGRNSRETQEDDEPPAHVSEEEAAAAAAAADAIFEAAADAERAEAETAARRRATSSQSLTPGDDSPAVCLDSGQTLPSKSDWQANAAGAIRATAVAAAPTLSQTSAPGGFPWPGRPWGGGVSVNAGASDPALGRVFEPDAVRTLARNVACTSVQPQELKYPPPRMCGEAPGGHISDVGECGGIAPLRPCWEAAGEPMSDDVGGGRGLCRMGSDMSDGDDLLDACFGAETQHFGAAPPRGSGDPLDMQLFGPSPPTESARCPDAGLTNQCLQSHRSLGESDDDMLDACLVAESQIFSAPAAAVRHHAEATGAPCWDAMGTEDL